MADTTKAAPEPRYKVPCEVCGAVVLVTVAEFTTGRVVCESCRATDDAPSLYDLTAEDAERRGEHARLMGWAS